jgi:flagellar hook-length control protein FliK
MRTIAQALAGAAQQESSAKPADGATPRPGPDAAATPVALPDPANAAAAASAGGAAALPAYAPDGHAHVPTPVGQPGFAQDFSDKVLVLARGGVQTAQISLDPAGLGPVGVSIQLHGHEATLAFTAAHEATRNALEEALPRLREMFASSGIQLSDATVGGRSQQDWSAPARSQGSGWQGGGSADSVPPASAEAGESAAGARAAALRLVDIYA